MSAAIKRKRLFYSPEDDLHVLREVVGQNPFQDPNRWTEIKTNVNELCGKDFSDRSLKERINLLAQRFCDKTENDIYKSGVEEEVSEIDDLLYTLLQLMNEFKSKPKKSTESSHQKGLNCREQAVKILMNETSFERQNVALSANDALLIEEFNSNPCIEINYHDGLNKTESNASTCTNNENITPGNAYTTNTRTPTRDGRGHNGGGRGRGGGRGGGVMTPTRTRSGGGLKQSSIRFLEKKNERWFEIRSRELALQEKKLEIESNEKKKRLEIDERRIQMEEKRLEMEEKRWRWLFLLARNFKKRVNCQLTQINIVTVFR